MGSEADENNTRSWKGEGGLLENDATAVARGFGTWPPGFSVARQASYKVEGYRFPPNKLS